MAVELVREIRGAVRSAIEDATGERGRIESLLASFTNVSGWSAAETLTVHGYQGACDWELIGTRVRSISQGADLSIQEAVAEAKRLRREAYFDAVRLAA